MRRALEIAISEGLEEQAGRAFANLCSMYCGQRRFAEAEQYFADGVAYCDEHDISTFGTCLRGGRTDFMAQTGRLGRGGGAEPGAAERKRRIPDQPDLPADEPRP